MAKKVPRADSGKVIDLQGFIGQRHQQDQASQYSESQMLEEIQKLRQQDDIVGAIALGIKAYEANPNDCELCLELGTMLGSQLHFDKALHYLKRAVTLDETNAEAHLFLGFVYYEQAHYRHAIASLQRCLSLDPSCIQASTTIADCWRVLGFPKMAISILEEISHKFSHSDESLNLLGVLYLETNETDHAIATLRQALNLNPQNPAIYTNLGVAYLHRGFIDMSIKYFNQATRLVSEDDDTFYNLAHALVLRGDYKEALVHSQKALDCAHSLRNGLLHCNILIALNEWDELNQYLDKEWGASTIEERSALQILRGKRAMHQRDYSEACAYFDLASQINKNNPDGPFQAAFAFIAQGNLEKAYQRIKRSISINDHIAGYFILRGDIENSLGKTVLAQQSWREALSIDASTEPDVSARLQGQVPNLRG